MAGEVNIATLVIAPLIGVASALLTIVLSPTLQHYFWRRQRRAERQLAVIDELNRVIAQLLHHCRVDYETAAAEHRAPRLDPQDPVLLSLSMLYAPLEALFSPSARKAVKELREQLIALGDTVPDQPWLQAADGVAQAHVNALRVLYDEVGIASLSLERTLAAHGIKSDGGLLHTKIHTWGVSPANMATTSFTLVGNSADSRGLAQCCATVCYPPPNARPELRLEAGATQERSNCLVCQGGFVC